MICGYVSSWKVGALRWRLAARGQEVSNTQDCLLLNRARILLIRHKIGPDILHISKSEDLRRKEFCVERTNETDFVGEPLEGAEAGKLGLSECCLSLCAVICRSASCRRCRSRLEDRLSIVKYYRSFSEIIVQEHQKTRSAGCTCL